MADDASRPSSPQPWATPSLATLSTCPRLDRSVSTASSISSFSGRSSMLSDGSRRRGYMRPQQTVFSDSARSRDSVQCLGSIAHLQYYFARTGLLDGKGGQLKRSRKLGEAAGSIDDSGLLMDGLPSPLLMSTDTNDLSFDESSFMSGLVESPIGNDDYADTWGNDQEPVMLPPTVSTYNYRDVYISPPPNMMILRRELREALDDAEKVLKEIDQAEAKRVADSKEGVMTDDSDMFQGLYEIQGLHLLDIITLAIRAAKNYYTGHESPRQLYALKSERALRGEMFLVLDILKGMAERNFAGGIKPSEKIIIQSWVSGLGGLLGTETSNETAAREERERWVWKEGDWTGRERERELLFLKSLDTSDEPLPEWTELQPGQSEPTPFLQALQSGLKLVHLHNDLVQKSQRQFEEIRVYHTDLAKPYRRADNLRFWVKAAELRWEVKLDVDVMGVVHGNESEAWRKLDDALLKWCRAVREELTLEWQQQQHAAQSRTPTLLIGEEFAHEVYAPR